MIWPPEAVAYFAGRAGFTGDDLVDAVAVALAVSGGDDAYHWTSSPAGAHDERGLWGLDVITTPALADVNLYGPQTAAEAAYVAWTASGGCWEAVTAYGPSAYRQALPVARAAAASPTGTIPLPSPLAAVRSRVITEAPRLDPSNPLRSLNNAVAAIQYLNRNGG